MTLSEGEKMIWASVYARHYDEEIKSPPREAVLPKNRDKWAEFESSCATEAAERAAYAVVTFRELETRLREGWGEGNEVFESYLVMKGAS